MSAPSSSSSSFSGEDRLSLLPDELLHHILSFIPSTKFHISTSVLSKRWSRLWTHHPNLHVSMPFAKSFDNVDDYIDFIVKPYVLFVDRCLRFLTSPSLHSVSLHLWLPTACSFAESKAHSKVADRWLRFASLRFARKLTVTSRMEPGFFYGRIPCSIFSCLSLTHLTIQFSVFPEVPGKFRGFRNLTSLRVHSGHISNKAFADLLHGCPLLEDLGLVRCVGLSFMEISPRISPRLKHLVLWTPCSRSVYFKGDIEASIDAPNLRSIVFGRKVTNINFKGSATLTEATLYHDSEDDFGSFDDWMKVVSAVSNVKILKVNYWFYQYEIPKNYSDAPLFKNLKELHCDIDWVTSSVLLALTSGFRECPLLEKLLINLSREIRSLYKDLVQVTSGEDLEDIPMGYMSPPYRHTDALLKCVEDEYEQDEWNPTECLGELDYSMHSLKVITVKEFLGSKNEMRLLEFLLGKAIALEQFIVFDLLKREEWDLWKAFATVPRASSQVQMRLSLWDNLEDQFFRRIFA